MLQRPVMISTLKFKGKANSNLSRNSPLEQN
jgi:hypothetical protein